MGNGEAKAYKDVLRYVLIGILGAALGGGGTGILLPAAGADASEKFRREHEQLRNEDVKINAALTRAAETLDRLARLTEEHAREIHAIQIEMARRAGRGK